MTTSAENVTFMIVRGVIALAIVGLGFYCIAQGIHFLALPPVEASQLHMHVLGLDMTASGLGAVIFGTGIVLCFIGKMTAPKTIHIVRDREPQKNYVESMAAVAEREVHPVPVRNEHPISYRSHEETTLVEGVKRPPTQLY